MDPWQLGNPNWEGWKDILLQSPENLRRCWWQGNGCVDFTLSCFWTNRKVRHSWASDALHHLRLPESKELLHSRDHKWHIKKQHLFLLRRLVQSSIVHLQYDRSSMICQGNKLCSCLARVRGVSNGIEISLELSKLTPLEIEPLPFVLMSPPLQPTRRWEAEKRVGAAHCTASLLREGHVRCTWCTVTARLTSLSRRVGRRKAQTERVLFCHFLHKWPLRYHSNPSNLPSAPPSFPPFLHKYFSSTCQGL